MFHDFKQDAMLTLKDTHRIGVACTGSREPPWWQKKLRLEESRRVLFRVWTEGVSGGVQRLRHLSRLGVGQVGIRILVTLQEWRWSRENACPT